MAKRNTPSWNEVTRRVIDQRLAMSREPRFFSVDEWQTLTAIAGRIVPQPSGRPPVPLAAMIDDKMAQDRTDGYRNARLPKMQEAWRLGLQALDADARTRCGARFHRLDTAQQDALLAAMQRGELTGTAWQGMSCRLFFQERVLHDIVCAYYAHPTSWNEIGFGGPASPRGYVRMGLDKRDPWEAIESTSGRYRRDRQPDPQWLIRSFRRAGATAVHPMCCASAAGCRCNNIVRTSRSTSPSSAPAPAVQRSPAAWPSTATRSWHSMPVRGGVRSRNSHPTSSISRSSTGPTSVSATATIRLFSAPTTAARRLAAAWCILPWSRCASARNGSAHAAYWATRSTGRSTGARCGTITTEVEKALNIAGPVKYPWGPKRPRYPYRPHELNAAALVMARGCDALGVPWVPTPLATLSAPHGLAHPCVYRGFCTVGCSTNAKQSTLVTWIPRAVRAGAEIRDLAMVGRIETNEAGLCTGVHYLREGQWRFQQARNVVVAGYAIETPRLLLMSANDRFPDGLANSSGLVGRNLMVQTNQGVWACFDEEIRWYKGPPSLALTEHWNYLDTGKDFFGGYAYMSQGPLPQQWAATQTGNHGLWGTALLREMEKVHPPGGPEDRRRGAAAGEQPRHPRR